MVKADFIKNLTNKKQIISKKITNRISRYLDHLVSSPAQISWGLTKSNVIDEMFFLPRYDRAVKTHHSHLPNLTQQDQHVVHSLEKEGIYITSLDELSLPNSEILMDAGQEIAQTLKDKAIHLAQQMPPGKYHEIHATKDQIMDHIDLVKWGLGQRLLDIIETYLGLPVGFDGVDCFLSVANGQEFGARAWHRDREDRRMLKVCVYLNDVEEQGGPLQCLKPPFNDYVCASTPHRYRSIEQAEMDSLYSPKFGEGIASCIGKRGTVILIDTARFYHRGKPPVDFDRQAIFFSYFSRSPWHPFFCGRFVLSPQEIEEAIPELSQRQRETVHWRKTLPKTVGWIPSSLI